MRLSDMPLCPLKCKQRQYIHGDEFVIDIKVDVK
jgi:hypothetical protein